MAEFQEYPKAVYHSKKGVKAVKDSAEESAALAQGFTTQAPSQFEDENTDAPGADPLREPAIVAQIDQEKTRLAGNQGAKDPADVLRDEENGDESSEDPEPVPAPKKRAGK